VVAIDDPIITILPIGAQKLARKIEGLKNIKNGPRVLTWPKCAASHRKEMPDRIVDVSQPIAGPST
jgi:hypothetical protein